MLLISNCLAGLVALLHLWFLVLEMALWTKPLGLKTFRMSPEKAETTRVLAANQGLYNGFLAAGIGFALIYPDTGAGRDILTFFLLCVVVAGAYGAWTVSRRILWIQALPAALSLVFLWLSQP